MVRKYGKPVQKNDTQRGETLIANSVKQDINPKLDEEKKKMKNAFAIQKDNGE